MTPEREAEIRTLLDPPEGVIVAYEPDEPIRYLREALDQITSLRAKRDALRAALMRVEETLGNLDAGFRDRIEEAYAETVAALSQEVVR